MKISVGSARWPLTVGLPLIVGTLMAWRGIVRLDYRAISTLGFSGDVKEMDRDMNGFESEALRQKLNVSVVKVAGHPQVVAIQSHASRPSAVVAQITAVSTAGMDKSLAKRKNAIHKDLESFQKQKSQADAQWTQAVSARSDFLAHYKRRGASAASLAAQVSELDRRLNETKMRSDYFSRKVREATLAEQSLEPLWKMILPAQKPQWPSAVIGWPLGAGVPLGIFLLSLFLLTDEFRPRKGSASDGLWMPKAPEPEPLPVAAAEAITAPPVELSIVPSESTLPSDPLTQKAAELYVKWMEVAKILYAPAPEPPLGVLESVGPLLEESSAFLPQGHDVLARYLAQTVTPGDLPAHVARTVLMTLTGAQQAGVTPEHRLGMALAALFHDLAVVPRPTGLQDDVGSDVGRLSASVLRRIPGLDPAVLAMVEEILIGMDEFKLDTWQNVATGKNLEPLSKVLREIDRFEKVMQKQKARLDRQLSRKTA